MRRHPTLHKSRLAWATMTRICAQDWIPLPRVGSWLTKWLVSSYEHTCSGMVMALEWFCAKPHLSLCLSWDSFVALVDTALFYLRMNIRKWCRTILFLQTICDVFPERCPTARKKCTKIICENLEVNKIDEKKIARVLFTCISGGWGAPARSLSSVMYFFLS